MSDHHYGPSDPDVAPPGSDEAIRHVGGGWYEVGEERVRGRDAAERAAEPDRPDLRETFSGPTLTLTLSREPDPATLTVDGPNGRVTVRTDGRTVKRPDGHFGRGRWTANYKPA